VWTDFFSGPDSAEAVQSQSFMDGRPLTISGLILTEILVGVRMEADARSIPRQGALT